MVNLLAKLRPTRRWLQFSMRTVLVFVSLLCVALSLWVVPLERRRRAVAAIEALGGRVTFIDSQTANESFPKTVLRRWLPQAYFDDVENVGFVYSQVTDAGLAPLEGLTTLQSLDLGATQVTDAGLVHLQGLTGLQSLSFINTQVTDAGLLQLQTLAGLQGLFLTSTQVTDSGLAHLKGLTSLQWLSLAETHVTDAGLANLKGLTGLKMLVLSNTKVTDDGVAELRKTLPNCQIFGP